MSQHLLNFTLVQSHIVWENIDANLAHYTSILGEAQKPLGVVVLPEMFATGFSMNTVQLAQTMDGEIVSWMKQQAKLHNCILSGSAMITEEGHCYNRLLWVLPNGQIHFYNKRHLFAYGQEDQHFTAGDKRVIVQVNGWKIALQVCYDLRFPVWSRNVGDPYDVLIYVANWPEKRQLAWQTLLRARAIENQCYVIGVNRIGLDGHNVHHIGDSAVIDPMGTYLWEAPQAEQSIKTVTLNKENLLCTREQFRFLDDGDNFLLL